MAVDSEGFETCWNPQLKNFIVVLIGCISIVNVVIGLAWVCFAIQPRQT